MLGSAADKNIIDFVSSTDAEANFTDTLSSELPTPAHIHDSSLPIPTSAVTPSVPAPFPSLPAPTHSIRTLFTSLHHSSSSSLYPPCKSPQSVSNSFYPLSSSSPPLPYSSLSRSIDPPAGVAQSSSFDSNQHNHIKASICGRGDAPNKNNGLRLSCARVIHDCNRKNTDKNKHGKNSIKKDEIGHFDCDIDYRTQHCSKIVRENPDLTQSSSSNPEINRKRKRLVSGHADTIFSDDDIPLGKDENMPDTLDRKMSSTEIVTRSISSTLWGFGFIEQERVG